MDRSSSMCAYWNCVCANQGFASPVCIAVHGLFAPGARALLEEAGAGRVLTCNTLPAQGSTIDVMPDVATAIRELLDS